MSTFYYPIHSVGSPFRPIRIRDPTNITIDETIQQENQQLKQSWWKSTKLSKRIKFRDRPDIFRGRYFYFTAVYGLFFVIGGIVGYSIKKNVFCLGLSVPCGVVLCVLAIVHAIDYYRGVSIEAIYIMIPFVLSIFIAILMTCIYSMGSPFVVSIIIAVVAWIATCLYFYAAVKDYGDGKYYRVNDFASQGIIPSQSTQRFDLSKNNEELTKLLYRD